MNGQLYFEQHPWDQALACIQDQQLGEVVEVSVHGVCPKGERELAAARWKARLEALLGPCAGGDELQGGQVTSFLARYQGGAIARLFLDDSRDDYSENFEIVTQKALLVWKPDVHPQGRMLGDEASFCDCAQPYSFQLEVV